MLLVMSLAVQASVPVYVWTYPSFRASDDQIKTQYEMYKSHGVVGVCVTSSNPKVIERYSRIAHECGLEYHAWLCIMLQRDKDSTWYTVNRLGESAMTHPAYVPNYTTLDPNKPEVVDYLVNLCETIAEIPTVDYVQLDYIRYADVILARGLWDKYHLVMNEEYPNADYCYCDKCVADFKAETGIDIRSVKDPSKCKEWAEFRCGKITSLVNKISDAVHAKGKKVSADVFPGPNSHAKHMVRQQWDEWNVDAFFPMNYNDFYLEPATWVEEITREEVKSLEGKNKDLYSGLFICRNWRNKAQIEDPEGHGMNPEELKVAVKGAMAAGAKGICLFSSRSMTEEHWQALDTVVK